MNIILFEEHEIGRPLPDHDPRAVHLLKILHKKTGDTFNAGILDGKTGKAVIEKTHNGMVFFSLGLTEEPAPRLPIEIALGFPRPIQLRRIFRDLSSMGVSKISLFGTDLSEKSYTNTTLLSDGGARSALIEGAVQARDTTLPKVKLYKNAGEFLCKENLSRKTLITADNICTQGSFSGVESGEDGFLIAVGSERGWSDAERHLFENAGFCRLSLGARALRTETAAIASTAIALAALNKNVLQDAPKGNYE
ncbi:MAG: RsmE family RNA methyltransferase [Spirochaetaceae bacterium]|jgi:RsmE family RNA methyltransferase|nr:RsmE family RNA methyltransferase [Spirochaetaceae bacterium]